MATRAEFLKAVRADHPEFQGVADDQLWTAVSQDHPDLVKQIDAGPQQPEERPGFWSTLGNDIIGQAKGLYDAVTSPRASTQWQVGLDDIAATPPPVRAEALANLKARQSGAKPKVPPPAAPIEDIVPGVGETAAHMVSPYAIPAIVGGLGMAGETPVGQMVKQVGKGAAKGAWKGGSEMVPLSHGVIPKLLGIPEVNVPAVVAGGAKGASIGGALGHKPGAIVGGAVGATAPIIKGAVEGGAEGFRRYKADQIPATPRPVPSAGPSAGFQPPPVSMETVGLPPEAGLPSGRVPGPVPVSKYNSPGAMPPEPDLWLQQARQMRQDNSLAQPSVPPPPMDPIYPPAGVLPSGRVAGQPNPPKLSAPPARPGPQRVPTGPTIPPPPMDAIPATQTPSGRTVPTQAERMARADSPVEKLPVAPKPVDVKNVNKPQPVSPASPPPPPAEAGKGAGLGEGKGPGAGPGQGEGYGLGPGEGYGDGSGSTGGGDRVKPGQEAVIKHSAVEKVAQQVQSKVDNLAEYLRSKGGDAAALDAIVEDPELTRQYLDEARAYGTAKGKPVPKSPYKGLDKGSDTHAQVRNKILELIEAEKNK